MSSGRDRMVVVVLLAVLVVGIILLAPGSTELGPPFQTAGRGPLGLSGLAAGLRSAGVATRDRDRPTLAPGLTLVVNPHDVTHADAASWMGSLRSGATLVYAAAYPDTFTRALGVTYTGGGAVVRAPARAAFPPVRVPSQVLQAVQLPPGSLSVYDIGGAGSESAMGVIPVGKGAVWFFSDPTWLTNQHVSGAALPLVLPIALDSGRTAAFDTYHQTGSGQLDVLPYLPGWVTLVVVEAAVGLILLCWALSRRLGPVRPAPPEDPGYLGDLAPSLAALYEQGGHLDAVTGPLADAAARTHRGARNPAAVAELRSARDVRTAVTAWDQLTTEGGQPR